MTLHKAIEAAKSTIRAASGFIMREDHKAHGDYTKINGAGHQMMVDGLEKALSTLPAKPMSENEILNILMERLGEPSRKPFLLSRIIEHLRDAGVLYVEDKK